VSLRFGCAKTEEERNKNKSVNIFIYGQFDKNKYNKQKYGHTVNNPFMGAVYKNFMPE
jgi:hypothetical protein